MIETTHHIMSLKFTSQLFHEDGISFRLALLPDMLLFPEVSTVSLILSASAFQTTELESFLKTWAWVLSVVVVVAPGSLMTSLSTGASAGSAVVVAGAEEAPPKVAGFPARRCFCEFSAKMNIVVVNRTLSHALALV